MEKLNNNNSNTIFQKNCPKHNKYQLDFILIQKGAQDNFLCFKCMQKDKISNSEVIHIKELQDISNEAIIQNFPPLENQNITEFLNDLNDLNMKQVIISINNYFDQLKQSLMTTIDQMQNEVKLKVSKIIDLEEQIMDVYNEISSKEDLSNTLNLNQDNIHQKIKEIIEEKYNNISTNTEKIKGKIDKYRKEIDIVSFEFPQKIQDHVTFMLKQIDFFKQIDQQIFDLHSEKVQNYLNSCQIQKQIQLTQNSIHSINFVKSTSYHDSQNQNITRGMNNQIEIQKSIKNYYAVSYADFILEPKKKYIFRIAIQSNSQNETFINIGLIKEQFKNTNQLFNNGLTYIERGDHVGISKIIKGQQVFEGRKSNINKVIELRINLENKILKVATYPNYDDVAELNDKTKIEDNQEYRLATELHYQEHKIIITDFQIVDQFDDFM